MLSAFPQIYTNFSLYYNMYTFYITTYTPTYMHIFMHREQINRKGNGCLWGWIVIVQVGMVLNWDRGGVDEIQRGNFSHRGWWHTGTSSPGRLLMPHPWRHSRTGWMWLWAAWSGGWRWSLWSFSTQPILWFYDSMILWYIVYTHTDVFTCAYIYTCIYID